MRRIGVTILLFVLGACSSGSSKSGGTSTTTTRLATAADRIARAGLLRRADFPKDYRAGPPTKGDDAAIRATPACAAFLLLIDHGIATAYSPSFFSRDALVGNKVDVFSDTQPPRGFIEELRNPAIMLLDEATSAIDSQSEQLIFQSLKEFSQGRTTLVITHRMTPELLEFISLVVVLERGRVLACGPHETLLGTCPAYQRLSQTPRFQRAA